MSKREIVNISGRKVKGVTCCSARAKGIFNALCDCNVVTRVHLITNPEPYPGRDRATVKSHSDGLLLHLHLGGYKQDAIVHTSDPARVRQVIEPLIAV